MWTSHVVPNGVGITRMLLAGSDAILAHYHGISSRMSSFCDKLCILLHIKLFSYKKSFIQSHVKCGDRYYSMQHASFMAYMKQMTHTYFKMEEWRSVTPWCDRLFFETPRASSFLGLQLVKMRHKNLVPLFFGVSTYPSLGSGRRAEPINVKCPMGLLPDT